MPAHRDVPWEIVEHTSAKHDIYRRYLRRWFPILLGGSNSYPSATYAEGFSGPGVYKGGEPGSPIIALESFLGQLPPEKGTGRFLFVDSDARCVDLLKRKTAPVLASSARAQESIPIKFIEGTCEEKLEVGLTEMGAWGHPILAVLDSWGNAPVSYSLLKRLANNPSSEVIVTFQPQHFVRFVSDLGDSADEVFGQDRRWREVANFSDGEAKRRHLLDCYRRSLSDAGFEYLLDFELIDRRGHSLYLVFGTSHRRGVEKMKDSLWEVDRSHGVGFRDPRDELAEALFDLKEPQLGPFGRLLLPEIGRFGSKGCQVKDLINFTTFHTVFRQQQIIRTVDMLRSNQRVEVNTEGRVFYDTYVRIKGG
ncbi:three-Cys-motif partner protein TcmP [Saccharopolyspora sp. NPDC002578]